jgi:hypothetical protein
MSALTMMLVDKTDTIPLESAIRTSVVFVTYLLGKSNAQYRFDRLT